VVQNGQGLCGGREVDVHGGGVGRGGQQLLRKGWMCSAKVMTWEVAGGAQVGCGVGVHGGGVGRGGQQLLR